MIGNARRALFLALAVTFASCSPAIDEAAEPVVDTAICTTRAVVSGSPEKATSGAFKLELSGPSIDEQKLSWRVVELAPHANSFAHRWARPCVKGCVAFIYTGVDIRITYLVGRRFSDPGPTIEWSDNPERVHPDLEIGIFGRAHDLSRAFLYRNATHDHVEFGECTR